MAQVDIRRLRIAYRRQGAGTPLMLLHGAVCDSRVWRVEIQAEPGEFHTRISIVITELVTA